MNLNFKFEERAWWKNSDSRIKEVILMECSDNSKLVDFLENLLAPTGSELIKIKNCEVIGSFIYFCFENRIQITNQIVEKELIFLRNQNSSEGKCLISINLGEKNFIVSNQGKAITTFFPNFDNKKLCNFPNKIEKELNKTFKAWNIEKIIDLGTIKPFSEVSPEKIPIFWVELKTMESLTENGASYIKEYNELSELFNKFDDAIALAIIGRKLKY